MLLLVDAVEHVHAVRPKTAVGQSHRLRFSAHGWLGRGKEGRREEAKRIGDALCKAATDSLHADERKNEREARALVLVPEDADRGLERERREDDALHDRRQGQQPARQRRKAERDGRAREEHGRLVDELCAQEVRSVFGNGM